MGSHKITVFAHPGSLRLRFPRRFCTFLVECCAANRVRKLKDTDILQKDRSTDGEEAFML